MSLFYKAIRIPKSALAQGFILHYSYEGQDGGRVRNGSTLSAKLRTGEEQMAENRGQWQENSKYAARNTKRFDKLPILSNIEGVEGQIEMTKIRVSQKIGQE